MTDSPAHREPKELIFRLESGEETWTIAGPTARGVPHTTKNPLADNELAEKLVTFRGLASRPFRTEILAEDEAAKELRLLAEAIGEHLTLTLFSAVTRQVVVHAMESDRARLLLRVAADRPFANSALALPWELIVPVPGRFAVEEGQLEILREVVIAGGAILPKAAGPLSVAATIAAPEDQVALNYEDEEYRLYAALSQLGQHVSFAELGGVDDLVELVGAQQANVIHFSGHGLPGKLVFEDEQGFADIVAIDDVISRLKQKLAETRERGAFPGLFFLASCHGATAAAPIEWTNGDASPVTLRDQGKLDEAIASSRETRRNLEVGIDHGPSTAARLHRSGFAQVIGYFGPVGDNLSSRAEESFYEAIARGETALQAAVAVRATLGEPLKDRRGQCFNYPFAWAQLAVYHRGPDHPLAVPGKTRRTDLRKRFHRRTGAVSGLPVLEIGFIGRRALQHEVRRRIRAGQRLIVLQGLGGLGKTALASHLLKRVLAPEPSDQLVLRCNGLDGGPVEILRDQAEDHGRVHQLQNWDERAQVLRQECIDPVRNFAAVIAELRRDCPGMVIYIDNAESLQEGPTFKPWLLGSWRKDAEAWWDEVERLSEDGIILASVRYYWESLDPAAWIGITPMSRAEALRMIDTFEIIGQLPWVVKERLSERADGRPRTIELLELLISERIRRMNRPLKATEIWGDLVEPILAEQSQRVEDELLLAEIWKGLDPAMQEHLKDLEVLKQPAPRFVVDKLGECAKELLNSGLLTRYRTQAVSSDGSLWQDRWALHKSTRSFLVDKVDLRNRREAHLAAGVAYSVWSKESGATMNDMNEGIQHFHVINEGDRAWPLVKEYAPLLRDAGRRLEALEVLKRCEASGTSGNNLAMVLALSAQTMHLLGYRQEEQRQMLERARVLASSLETKGHILSELGRFLWHKGEIREAASLLRHATDIMKETFDSEHAEYLAALHSLGTVTCLNGDYLEGEKILRRCLHVGAKITGIDHPSYGSTLAELANVLVMQGRLKEAEGLLWQSLKIQENAVGMNHPDVGTVLSNLAVLLNKTGRANQSEPLLRRCLEITRDHAGRGGFHEAQVLATLAVAQALRGNTKAPMTALSALEMLHASVGPEHPTTRLVTPDLLRILSSVQDVDSFIPRSPGGYSSSIAALDRALADHVQKLAISALLKETDAKQVIDRLEADAREAEEMPGATEIGSFLRSVVALLRGEEPGSVPSGFVSHIEEIKRVRQADAGQGATSSDTSDAESLAARDNAARQIHGIFVMALKSGVDIEPVIERFSRVADRADEKQDEDFASFLRAIIAIVRGEEPKLVPPIFGHYVDAVRDAKGRH